MKVYGIPVRGIPLCALCTDPDAGKLVTQKFLDRFECDCGGQQIEFTPECHPEAGLDAEYCKAHGAMTIVCHECHELVAAFKVAARS